MEDVEAATSKLQAINKMGVSIAIDDFGTGYTSISFLREFPVSVLKIDQSFIKGIPFHQNNMAITSGVIALGHNLGLKIVAEGVETLDQLTFLSENGCDLAQGYFFSPPLPENKVVYEYIQHIKKEITQY